MRRIQVRVKPNARESGLEEAGDGTWLARVKSPPAEGKANAELIMLVARRFGLRMAQVTVKAGASGRTKLIELDE